MCTSWVLKSEAFGEAYIKISFAFIILFHLHFICFTAESHLFKALSANSDLHKVIQDAFCPCFDHCIVAIDLDCTSSKARSFGIGSECP